MLNKKRLAMIAVAASMVLPNNLVYLATTTPVFAEGTDTDENNGTNLTQATITSLINSATGKYIVLTDQDYILTEDIDLGEKYLLVTNSLNIDLNGHNITSSASHVMWVYQSMDGSSTPASLTITVGEEGQVESTESVSHNTISSTSTKAGDDLIYVQSKGAKLTIDSPYVTLKSQAATWGVVLGSLMENPGEINLSNITFDNCGFTAHGELFNNNNEVGLESDLLPKVNLTNINIIDGCIYQAGLSTINVTNCTINSKEGGRGIETRAGNLKVNGGVINGGTEGVLSTPNSSGTTSINVGVAIAQHTTNRPINVEITDAYISGTAALFIADPQGNTTIQEDPQPIGVTVTNSTLVGQYPVGYTLADINFSTFNLIDSVVEGDVKHLIADETDSTKLVSDYTLQEKIPYTITNKSIASISAPLNISKKDLQINEATDFSSTDEESNEKTINDIENMKQKLEDALNKTDSVSLPVFSSSTSGIPSEPKSLNYTYTVDALEEKVTVLEDGTYSFNATISAKIDKVNFESVVRLAIVLKSTSDSDSEDNSETESIMVQLEDDEVKPSYLYLDVLLKDVLNEDHTKFSASKIEEILKANNYTNKYDETALLEFDKTPLKDSYEVINTSTPIIIEAKEETVQPPKNPGTGHKPTKPKPEEPVVPVATPTPMYRLYNRLTGEHLFTIDKNERDNLLTSDTWKDEGQGWIAPSESAYPVYRLLNPNTTDHHYTMDKNEFDTLPSYGWVAEGVAFFSADKDNPENVILYRLYNPNETGAGSHHYTADTNERDTLVGLGWTYEGLAWAGLPETK